MWLSGRKISLTLYSITCVLRHSGTEWLHIFAIAIIDVRLFISVYGRYKDSSNFHDKKEVYLLRRVERRDDRKHY